MNSRSRRSVLDPKQRHSYRQQHLGSKPATLAAHCLISDSPCFNINSPADNTVVQQNKRDASQQHIHLLRTLLCRAKEQLDTAKEQSEAQKAVIASLSQRLQASKTAAEAAEAAEAAAAAVRAEVQRVQQDFEKQLQLQARDFAVSEEEALAELTAKTQELENCRHLAASASATSSHVFGEFASATNLAWHLHCKLCATEKALQESNYRVEHLQSLLADTTAGNAKLKAANALLCEQLVQEQAAAACAERKAWELQQQLVEERAAAAHADREAQEAQQATEQELSRLFSTNRYCMEVVKNAFTVKLQLVQGLLCYKTGIDGTLTEISNTQAVRIAKLLQPFAAQGALLDFTLKKVNPKLFIKMLLFPGAEQHTSGCIHLALSPDGGVASTGISLSQLLAINDVLEQRCVADLEQLQACAATGSSGYLAVSLSHGSSRNCSSSHSGQRLYNTF